MIKTTLRKIVEAGSLTPSGRTPMVAFSSLGLPPAKAWQRMTLVEEIEAHQIRFNKTRQATFAKFETKDDADKIIAISEAHPRFAEIDAELGEFLAVEVTLDAEPVPLAGIGDGPISADEMKGIRFLLK